LVQPVYLAETKAAGIQGGVMLQAWVSKEGRITNLQQTFGLKELASAATEAAQRWRYRPFVLLS